ncbi:hypothetical protein [Cyclobacterium plantarum]|uniref:O-antigen ligase domain-containing protein n=1 Tax=Cyclobacterium plantarum TaxID=2716263 RepID=A0ABX0HG18_9BACT|nr:hypothetical protein [Cyclobacterium plantarum]NHE59336.1 hypothetical protein [Cyclobacterium plantarum]
MNGKPNLYSFVFFSFGFFTFSPVSSFITIELLRLPFAVPEFFFLAFFPLIKNKVDFRLTRGYTMQFSMLFLFLILFISFIYQKYDLISILSTFRGYFYLVLAISVFNRYNETSLEDVFYICFGSTFGWLILSLLQFNSLVVGNQTDGSLAVYGNMVALSLLVIIPVFINLRRIQVFSLIVCTFLSFFSGVRRQIFVFIISLTLSFFSSFKIDFFQAIKRFIIPVLFIFLIIINYSSISSYFFSISPDLHLRVFLKSESLLQGEFSNADNIRSNNFNIYFNSIDDLIFPRGFVSKRTSIDSSLGIFIDFPLLELTYTFGLFLVIIFFIFYLYNLIKRFIFFFFLNHIESGIWFSSGLILLFLLFLDGTFLRDAYITPFTGFVVANVIKRKGIF